MNAVILAPLAADGRRRFDVDAMSFLLLAICFRFGRMAGIRSDRSANLLILLDMNRARRVGICVEFLLATGDFDSAIPRFDSWRPSQPFHRVSPPVRAYVKRGKTDAIDAAAICEAVTRPTM